MKKLLSKISGYISLVIILLTIFGLIGCGGINQATNPEPTEEVIPTKEPTEKVMPTEEPTKEVIPTEEPTKEVLPTEEPTEEAIPTEEIVELPPIMGTYSVTGVDLDDNKYESTLEITASYGFFQWNWLNREPVGLGVHQDGVVTVAWGEEQDCNPISYVIQENGHLKGIYTEMDATRMGSEESVPLELMGEGIEGTYVAFGSTPSGNMYGCDLEITLNGDVYDFTWDCGNFYHGVGIQRGNLVSVAFSESKKTRSCMVVSYLINEDSTLDGIWTYKSATELGTDVATPETSE